MTVADFLFNPPASYELPLALGQDLVVDFQNTDANGNPVNYPVGATVTLVIDSSDGSPAVSAVATISTSHAVCYVAHTTTDLITTGPLWRCLITVPGGLGTPGTVELVAANGVTSRHDGRESATGIAGAAVVPVSATAGAVTAILPTPGTPGATGPMGFSPYWDRPPTNMVTTLPRWVQNSVSITTGELNITYFQSGTNLTVNNVTISTGDTAASGLTLAKAGIYAVDGSYNLTSLLGSTANATSILGGTFTPYTIPLLASVSLTANTTYAVAVLIAASGMPNLVGSFTSEASSSLPPLHALLTSQSNLPATVTSASSNFRMIYARLS